jgi:hypothetical protein
LKLKSDARDAVSDIVHSLRSIFKKYTRTSRKKAWKAIQSTQGKKNISDFLHNPDKPIVSVKKWISFKEWSEIKERKNKIN